MTIAIQEVRAVSLQEERELLEVERSNQYQSMMKPVKRWDALGIALILVGVTFFVMLVVAIQPYLAWWHAQPLVAQVLMVVTAVMVALMPVLAGMLCRSNAQNRKESIEASFIQLQLDQAVERAIFRWLGASKQHYLEARGTLSLGAAVRQEVEREAALVR